MSASPAPTSGFSVRILSTIDRQFDELDAMVAGGAVDMRRFAPEVSNWCVGEQIHHLALVGAYVHRAIQEAIETPPRLERPGPTFIGRLVLTTGFIPRGKGKAPEAVLAAKVELDALREGLAKARGLFRSLEPKLAGIENSRGRSAHPILGNFTGRQWLTFMDIHTKHHFKIIRDIRKAAR